MNQTVASTQALAAFSSWTSRPVAAFKGLRIHASPVQIGREGEAVGIKMKAASQAYTLDLTISGIIFEPEDSAAKSFNGGVGVGWGVDDLA